MDIVLRNTIQGAAGIPRDLATLLVRRMNEEDLARVGEMTADEIKTMVADVLAPGNRLPPSPTPPEVSAPAEPEVKLAEPEPEVQVAPLAEDTLDLD